MIAFLFKREGNVARTYDNTQRVGVTLFDPCEIGEEGRGFGDGRGGDLGTGGEGHNCTTMCCCLSVCPFVFVKAPSTTSQV